MSIRGVYSLCNGIKDRYIVRRPDIGAILEKDASMPPSKRRQTAETGFGGSRLNHASSEPMEGGRRSSLPLRTKGLRLRSRALGRSVESAEVQQDNNSQETLPQTQSQFSIHSSTSGVALGVSAEGRASLRARTEHDMRPDPVAAFRVVSSNDESQDCSFPPPYSGGPAVPSYEIVVEEEWRRVRSLRRRTLGHATNTATSWCRPGLPSAFFDRQRNGQRRRESSRLRVQE